MPCEACNVQFGIITRKKSCYECRRLFCKNCLEKRQDKILCHNCLIFTKRPLSKVDLGQLKSKDLILYLQSKHISTTGCVEKDDLINLVIAHVNSVGNSPRSPEGSTGSGGNGRTFNFSSPSSTGGSSGNGRGGSQSGSSSRNFYASSAESCANTFDQIKNTCQNLFSSISDKLNSDVPKTANFGPRYSNTSTEDNLRPRAQTESVHQQPRFGTNDVYWVHDQHTPRSGTENNHPVQRDIVPNEMNRSASNDFTESSGITSGADSSANTSSVSSPVHEKTASFAQSSVKSKFSLSERIDNMLASEENQNDCDCSDEEEQDTPRRKESKKVVSEENLLSEAGASQPLNVAQLPIPESKTDTSSSSFDELIPDPNESLPEIEMTALTDTESWQVVNNPESSDTQESAPTLATTTAATMTETTDSSSDLNSSDKLVQAPAGNDSIPNHVARRRSDSFLMITHGANSSSSTVVARSVDPRDTIAQSSQPTSADANKCFKCGKRRSGIRKQLKKIRKMLDTASVPEADKRRQLEAFLSYLERRNKSSFELSEAESMSEDASISLTAEGDHLCGEIATGLSIPTGDSNDGSRHHTSNYPRAEAEDIAEKTNVYSSGNQQLADMTHIQLSDIKESADLNVLSVKQLKKILVLNRVDFKGCCEKAELRERVLRLWFDYKSIASPERLAADDLCRICMDAPINCVILECGHMATCINCGKVLSECPICRQYIVRVVRSFKV